MFSFQNANQEDMMSQIYTLARRLACMVLLGGWLTACGGGDGETAVDTTGAGDNQTSVSDDELEPGTTPIDETTYSDDEETGAGIPTTTDSSSEDGIDLVGVVHIQHISPPTLTSTQATANFYRLDTPVPADFPWSVLLQQDSCRTEEAADPNPMQSLGIDYTQATPLLAGEVVTISSQNGSYASLIPESAVVDGDIDYDSGEIGAEPFDLDLVMSIPGDEFPAVDALLLPPQARFDSTFTDQISELASNHNLRWSVSAIDDESIGLVTFVAAFSNPDSTLPVWISCVIPDNGEFTVPDNALQGLSENAEPVFTSVVHTTFSRRVMNGLGFFIMQTHIFP